MPPKRILFLDDDTAFLEVIGRVFAAWSRGEIVVEPVTSAGQAIQKLQAQTFDLAVLDVKMPVVDGMQFLQLLQRKLPEMQKAVLTGFPDEATRAICLNSGASLFLGKPRTADEMESVYRALHTLVMLEPEEGFRGVMHRVGLPDVLQMECAAGKSSLLEVSTGERAGRIFIRKGTVVHAEADGLAGAEAFYLLLSMLGGSFHLKSFQEPAATTIQMPLTGLLLEAAYRQDQSTASAAIPPAPRLFKSTTRVPEAIPSAPQAALLPPAPAGTAPHMDLPAEVVVCDGSGAEVSFAWQSADADLRAAFLEFLRNKAGTFERSVPAVGALRRLEIHGADMRAVILLEAGRTLYANAGKGSLDIAALGDFLSCRVDAFMEAPAAE